MKITDLVESIITETDEALLQKLLDKFRKTTGEFNNASHKFYTVRKAVANELEGEEQEAVRKASPGEFFNYLKSQKAKAQAPKPEPKPEVKPEEPKQDLELRGVTHEELNDAGTVYAIIDKWVDLYHPKYSAEEITQALFGSAMGAFEDLPYIRSEVNSAITKKSMRKREKEEAELRPRMEKQFKVSKEQVEEMKGTDIYRDVLNDMIKMVKNQPRVPGQKPQPAHKMFGYIANTLKSQYDTGALRSFKEGEIEDTKKYMTKRAIVKNVSSLEFRNWYASNK